MTTIRTENSRVLAEFIIEKIGAETVDELFDQSPGEYALDSVLIKLFYAPSRVLTTTSYAHNNIGKKTKKSNKSRYMIIIDFIDREIHDIPGLKYSDKGFAVFSYLSVLSSLANKFYNYDFKKTGDLLLRPNRNYIIESENSEKIDDSFDANTFKDFE